MTNPTDSMADNTESSGPVSLEGFRIALALFCESGCDRIPLKVRNLHVPFYLAGFSEKHVFLSHAETCMVSEFTIQDLELPTLTGLNEIQALVFAWLDSAEGVASKELIAAAQQAAKAGVSVPVVLRWPVGGHTRSGFLTSISSGLGGSGAQWVTAVESTEGTSAVFRYGLSRIATAMHDGKKLTMKLKPGTVY